LQRRESFERRLRTIEEVENLLQSHKISHEDIAQMPELEGHLGQALSDALRDPKVGCLYDDETEALARLAKILPESMGMQASGVITALLNERYKGYQEKENRLAHRLARAEKLFIPQGFDYKAVKGLSQEALEKLSSSQPLTLGQASRIPGVRKSDIALLYIALSKPKG